MLCNPPQFSESDELTTKWKKRASMIAADPDKRIALQDCLKHPFLLDDQGR